MGVILKCVFSEQYKCDVIVLSPNIKSHSMMAYLCFLGLILVLFLLITSCPNSIAYEVSGEGRSLDLYTQKGGEGPGEPGGEFFIGEIVRLISRVTYNGDPVANKWVSFEIRNSLGETVLIRVAETDIEGFARIDFRIPEVLESEGVWSAIALVEIAEETVSDTVSFQVYRARPVGGHSPFILFY